MRAVVIMEPQLAMSVSGWAKWNSLEDEHFRRSY